MRSSRWNAPRSIDGGKGDPGGYLDIMATDVTYFDPIQDGRVDGRQRLADLFAPFAGKIKIDRYDMVNPKVQRHGDIAILTFNIVNYRKLPDGSEQTAARWNTTEAYSRIGDRWRIVHSHFSYVKPQLKTTPSGGS